jgi:hypothetical protein
LIHKNDKRTQGEKKKLGGVLLSSITRNRNRKKEGQNNKDGVFKAKKLECTHRVGFALIQLVDTRRMILDAAKTVFI